MLIMYIYKLFKDLLFKMKYWYIKNIMSFFHDDNKI